MLAFKPFWHWVIDSWLTAETLPPPPPDNDWPGWEARYENDVEQHKRTSRRLVFGQYAPIFERLRSPLTVEAWSERTGVNLLDDPTLHGGGLHVTDPGGWLNCHLDYALHPKLDGMERRLNLIVFLNREWREEWGGAFELCDPEGNVVKRIFPAPGRLIAFETSDLSYHGTQQVAAEAPPRVTAAVYFLAKARQGATRKRALFMPTRR
jgi:Rps23 Pro-64 3,4-dihydroxylase Tpa1-like proline 4-hydroxylase